MALGDLTQSLAADPATQNGGFLDANTIKRRQALADALMQDGRSYAPVQSWTQGAARLAAALNGSIQQGRLDRDAQAGNAAWRSDLRQALAPGGQQSPSTSLAPNLPTFAGGGTGVAMPTGDQRDLMIRTIAGEAGGESPEGQAAVAHVIMNRVADGNYGRDPASVIMAPKQFSVWNAGDPAGDIARKLDPSSPQYQRIGSIVDGVMGGSIQDPTGGARNYYNPRAASPTWGPQLAQSNDVTIGNHRFVGTGNGVQVASADPQQVMAYAANSGASPAAGQTAIDAATVPMPPPRPSEQTPTPGGSPYGALTPNTKQTLNDAMDFWKEYNESDEEGDDKKPGAASPNSATVTGTSINNQTPTSAPMAKSPMGAALDANKSAQIRAAMAVIGNPYATPAAQQIAAMIIGNMSKDRAPVTLSAGAKLIDPATGRLIASNPKEDDGEKDSATVKDYKFYLKTLPAGQQPMPFDTWSTAKARAGAANISNNVDMNSGQTYDQQLAQGLGKAHSALSNGVEDAQARARDLAAMQGAIDSIQQNGGTTGGMGQQQALDLKKTINAGTNALGIDTPFSEGDIADKEFLTKFNRQIAGAQAKGAMGSRVTNFEMANYLKANPGLDMSVTGNQRLIGIQSQIEQRNIAVGNAIRQATGQAISQGQKINPLAIQKIITDYDDAHHIKDPVTGQDLTQSYALPEFQGGANAGFAASHSKNLRSMKTKGGVRWSVEP